MSIESTVFKYKFGFVSFLLILKTFSPISTDFFNSWLLIKVYFDKNTVCV